MRDIKSERETTLACYSFLPNEAYHLIRPIPRDLGASAFANVFFSFFLLSFCPTDISGWSQPKWRKNIFAMFGGEFYPGGICVSSSFEVLLWDEEKKTSPNCSPFPKMEWGGKKRGKMSHFVCVRWGIFSILWLSWLHGRFRAICSYKWDAFVPSCLCLQHFPKKS